MRGLGGLVYIVIGLFVAFANNYFEKLDNFGDLFSALLAILIWPLVLIGVDPSVSF